MSQQRILRQRYSENLISRVKNSEAIELFMNSEFQIDDEHTLVMPYMERPLGLCDKLDSDDDMSSAIAIYEAFHGLSPLEAADPRLWNYLSIIDLYPYLLKRWPNVFKRKEGTNEKTYILEHFLLEKSSHLLRHGLSGLWWSVKLSIDESDREDKYRLTKVLFWNQTLRTRTMGTYLIARNKKLALGFLDYCYERGRANFGNFEKEHQELTEYLNQIGGAKPLPFFSREEIKELLLIRFPIPSLKEIVT